MKPTKIFTEFSVISIPCVITAFAFFLVIDSRPKYHPPSSVTSSPDRLSLMLTEDGRLAVELFSGYGFDAESLQPVQGNTLGIGDRH